MMAHRPPASLRSRLIAASLLWTGGLLALMHMISLLVLHAFPRVRGSGAVFPVALGVGMMAAGLLLARRALAPLAGLRGRLSAVREGAARRVVGAFPSEVAPLIAELNQLLDERERAVQRAQASAGDLAHGLKTPLALLAQQADRARANGNLELSASIAEQVDRMTRQVNYQLARARASASGQFSAAPLRLAPAVEALARTVTKLYAARPQVRIATSVPADIAVRMEPGDFDEIAGNLLDNACKWARSAVVIRAEPEAGGEWVRLTVEDDGPGLAPELHTAVLERGVRADQAAPGTGLGLAIVRDLVEIYGGAVALSASPAGGLLAAVRLPRAAA